jgi:LPXTG-motif cell wall-anchored protein
MRSGNRHVEQGQRLLRAAANPEGRASARERRAAKALALVGVSVCVLALASPAVAAKGSNAKVAKPKRAAATAAPVLATLTVRTPNVEVKKKGKSSYTAGKNGQTLRQGDALRTDTAGFAEISYTDGSYTRLGPGTEFSITKLTNKKGARQTRGSLTIGSTFSRAAKVSETGAFEIEAGDATATVEGTVFVVIATKQGTQVSYQFISLEHVLVVRFGSAAPVALDSDTTVTLEQGQLSGVTTVSADDLLGNVFIAGNVYLDGLAGHSDLLPKTEEENPNPQPQTTQPPQTPQTPQPPPQPPPEAPVVQAAGDIQVSQYPPNGELTVDNPNVEAGGEVSFRGSGCLPTETVVVLFDGAQVGTLPTDGSGSFAGTLRIPQGTTPGPHILTVRGASCELNAVINVLGAAAIAFTGASSNTLTYVLAGAAAVALGAALVFGTRRRHSVSMRRGSPPTSA